MYIPLFNKTHYSFQVGYSKTDELVKKCCEYDIPALSINDNILSGAISFDLESSKKDIKAIYSIHVMGYDVCLYAKNFNGYLELIKISNKIQCSSISIDDIIELKNVIVVCLSILDLSLMEKLKSNLKENFFIGIMAVNKSNIEISANRDIAKKYGIPAVAINESYYSSVDDREKHLTLLCSSLKKTIREVYEGSSDSFMNRVLSNNNFHLHKYSEFVELGNTSEEIGNTKLISDMCEKFSVLGQLSMPKFSEENESDLLKSLCVNGWKKKIAPILNDSNKEIYVNRIRHELSVIDKCGLSGYFLIVQDYVNWAKKNGMLVGAGRGSAGSSLISYLTDITIVDPIKHKLLFERFYNEGRNSPGRIAIPDIDVDFPSERRHEVIDYVRKKYGSNRVSQVATFGCLKGRGALKEVFRIHEICDDRLANEITKNLPQEGAISDKLEQDKESSIIRWTLKHNPRILSDWCVYDSEKNEYHGDMATSFKMAVDIEGTYKSYGKHASAVIISANTISDRYQMLTDKSSNDMLLGVEYEHAEKSGLPKMDILGLSTLDMLMKVRNLLRNGKL